MPVAPLALPPTARTGPLDSTIEVPHGTSLRVDLLGRWHSARIDHLFYRRTVETDVVVYPDKHAPPVSVVDHASVHSAVAALASRMLARFRDPEEFLQMPPGSSRDQLLQRLALAASWTSADYDRLRTQFARTYDEPVEILPPDRTRDVYLLPATGCPNAGCTFCAFYQGRPFRVKTPSAFQAHARAVAELFGPALGLRTGVFLGPASAISLSQTRLLQALAVSRDVFGELRRGVGAFWETDYAPARSAADWSELADAGLRAVYVGLETGDPVLRKEIGKGGDLDAFLRAIATVKASPVRAGVIVLAGIGGAARAAEHTRATIDFVARLPLERTDVVYVSPVAGSMPANQLDEAEHALRQGLKAVTQAPVVPYAMAAFRYYA